MGNNGRNVVDGQDEFEGLIGGMGLMGRMGDSGRGQHPGGNA